MFTGAGTEATTADAVPHALVGADCTVVLGALAHALIRQLTPDGKPWSNGQPLSGVFVAAAVGALPARR